MLLGVCKYIITKINLMIVPADRQRMNQLMKVIKLPVEIKRAPRPLVELTRWKASEFRAFLFYVGPIVLHPFVSKEIFRHFLSLSIAIRLLMSDKISQSDLLRAGSAMQYFTNNVVQLYGANAQSYNIHSLRYLVLQVREGGPVWVSSAFGFESANHYLKMPFTGTRNHAILISKRYLLRQDAIGATVKKDSMENFIKFRLKKEKLISDFERMTIIRPDIAQHITVMASTWLSDNHSVHGRLQHGLYQLHSISYSRRRSSSDSVVSFLNAGLTCYGEIEVFVTINGICFALIKQFNCEPRFSDFEDVIVPSGFYVFVEDANAFQLVWIISSNIVTKCCVLSRPAGHMVLSPIFEMFEHN